MLSIDGRTVPFLEHNDPTRVQMACGQTRQAVSLLNPEIPMIRTGYEEQYLHESTYMFEAEHDGMVMFLNEEIMIIMYYNEEFPGDVIDLGGKLYNCDGFNKKIVPILKPGDKFKKGDVLAKHNTISNDGFLQLGKNLKTTYISSPYTYKDAIVISESCSKKMEIPYIYSEEFTFTESIPIIWNDGNISLKNGSFVKKGDPVFIIKPREPRTISDIVHKGKAINAKATGYFYYEILVDSEIEMEKEKEYYEKISTDKIKDDKIKALVIDKIFIKYPYLADAYKRRYAPEFCRKKYEKMIIVKYWIYVEKPLFKGCKISNRHGNKGVISKIFPDDQMPMFEDGPADVIVSPLSIPSRMNVGQLFELHLTRCSEKVFNIIKNETEFSKQKNILFEYLSMVSEKPLVSEFNKNFTKKTMSDILSSGYIQLIQRPFNSISYKNLLSTCHKYGMDNDLKENCIYRGSEKRAAIGYNYFMRLEHEPYKKLFGRSVGPMGRNGQPIKGGNAHRFGELETWSMIAHQASECLIELMVSKSDNQQESARLLKYFHDKKEKNYTPQNLTVGAAEIMTTLLKGSGIDFKIE